MNSESLNIAHKYDVPIAVSQVARGSSHTSSVSGGIDFEIMSPRDWDEMATEFADINPEQTGSFNVGHWGAGKVECFAIRRFGRLIGGGSVLVRSIPFASTGIAVLKWGPVWRSTIENTGDNCQDKNNYKTVIAELVAEYCEKRGFHLTIMPPSVPAYDRYMREVLLDLGFNEGAYLAAPKRYIVNTNQSTETLMAGFEQKYRYNLRKALKNDFKIELVDNKDGMQSFLELYRKMIDRKGFLDASAIKSLETFFNNSPEKTKPRIVLVSHENRVMAGGIIFTSGEMASYMYGATDDRALRLKAGYALHWWICQYLCAKERVKWYDLGGNDLDAGLHQFKKGMVGKTGVIQDAPPRYHYASGHFAKLLGSTVFGLRDTRAAVERAKHKLAAWLGK